MSQEKNKPTLLEKIYRQLTEDTKGKNISKPDIGSRVYWVKYSPNAFVKGDTVFVTMTIGRKHPTYKFKVVDIDKNYLYFENGQKAMYVNNDGKINRNIVSNDAWDNALAAHIKKGNEKETASIKQQCSVSYEEIDGNLCVVFFELSKQRKYYYTHTNGTTPSEPVMVNASKSGKSLNWISTNKMNESFWVLRKILNGDIVPVKITKEAAERVMDDSKNVFVPEEYFDTIIDNQRKSKRFIAWKPEYKDEIEALLNQFKKENNVTSDDETKKEMGWFLQDGETVPEFVEKETAEGVEIPESTMLVSNNKFRAFNYNKSDVDKLITLCPWLSDLKAKWYVKSKNAIYNAVPKTK